METDVRLLYGGQKKNMGNRKMRKVKQMEENEMKENRLVVIIMKMRRKKKNR